MKVYENSEICIHENERMNEERRDDKNDISQ